VASVNVFFFYSGIFLKENYKKALFIFVGVIVLIFAEIFPFTSYFSEEGNNLVTVLVLQGNNPFIFSYDDSYFKKSVYAYKESLEEGLSCYPETDIIVIPESSNFLPMLSFFEGRNEGFLAQELLRGRRERLLIYGDYDREENVSLVEVVSNEGTSQSLYKNLLMPLGEYPPYLVVFFAKIFGQEGWISEVSSVRNIKNIQNADKIAKTSFGKIAALECSEILSPSVYRKIKKEKPDMVFHLQRLSAFHEDTRVFRYMLAASQVRAAELRIPIIGAVDGSGYSYVIDKFGEIQKIGNKDTKFISAEISI
jgi:apolipoprotein N-acyltransferase